MADPKPKTHRHGNKLPAFRRSWRHSFVQAIPLDLPDLGDQRPKSSISAGSLCEICTSIFYATRSFDGENPWQTPQYPHHRTLKSLCTSADFGCQICIKLWDQLGDSRTNARDKESPGTAVSQYWITDERTRAFSGDMYELYVCLSPGCPSAQPLEFILQPVNEVKNFITRREISDKILSGPSLDLAKEWFDNCTASHTHCNQRPESSSNNWMPTRLVDLSSTDTLRIIKTEDSSSSKPYMTLSHQWGDNLEFKLTNSNLEEMQQGFSPSLLPRTLADAIGVCKQFSINYIWIDNLCILQDFPHDFEHEADSMDKIYGNAMCNISATAARDGHQDLFTERPIRSLEVCEVMIQWRNRPRERYVILDRLIWTDGVARAPANRRGWIVQERLLARRVLHFGSRQLFWECRNLEACETWPKGLPTMVHTDDNGFKSYENQINGKFRNPMDDLWEYRAWNKVLYTYTGSKLSFPKDKLIALAGVASRMQKAMEGDYLAGLWRPYFTSDLLWRTKNCGEHSVRAHPYRAPSWSWASVDVEITRHVPFRNDMKPMCTIFEVEVEPLTDNVFGQILSGFIRIQATLYTSTRLRSAQFIHKADDTSMVAMDINPASLDTDNLYLCILDTTSLLRHKNPALRGLVLEPTDAAKGEFRRVGYFHVAERRVFRLLDEVDIDQESQYPSRFYDEARRQHMFTIV